MSAQAQYAFVKEHLDYEMILQALGIPYVKDAADGTFKFRCLNPDHHDSDPSMRLRYVEAGSRNPAGAWRCWNGACSSWRGDVFDLIRIVRPRVQNPISGEMEMITLSEAVSFATGGKGFSSEAMIRAMCDADIRSQSATKEGPLTMPVPQAMPAASIPLINLPPHRFFTEMRNPPIPDRWAKDEECVVIHAGPYEGYMAIPLRWIDGTPFSFQCVAVEPWAQELRASKGFKNAGSKLYPHECPISSVLYGCHRAPRGQHLVICEGVFDAWRIWEADDIIAGGGEYFGLGTMSNNFTDEQEEILRWLEPERITVARDNKPKDGEKEDTAGIALAAKIIERLGSYCPVHVANLPVGNDPDSTDIGTLHDCITKAPDSINWAISRGLALAGRGPAPAPTLEDLGL